jgi:hypothetical protein
MLVHDVLEQPVLNVPSNWCRWFQPFCCALTFCGSELGPACCKSVLHAVGFACSSFGEGSADDQSPSLSGMLSALYWFCLRFFWWGQCWRPVTFPLWHALCFQLVLLAVLLVRAVLTTSHFPSLVCSLLWQVRPVSWMSLACNPLLVRSVASANFSNAIWVLYCTR